MKPPPLLMMIFGVLAFLGFFTSNPVLTMVSILALPLFMTLLWRKNEPPVLLLAIFFQWLQVTAKIFHADFLGVRVETISFGPRVVDVIGLSLAGLVVLALGIRLSLNWIESHDRQTPDREDQFSLNRLFMLCLALSLVSQVVIRFAWAFRSLTQILLSLMQVKWVFLFMLGYLVLKRKEKIHYFTIIFLIEFVGGIGFFSEFRTVLFVSLIAIFTVRYKPEPRTMVGGGIVITLLILLALVWTSIKDEYREYLNQGTRQQVVMVSRTDRLMKVVELIGDMDGQTLLDATEPLFERLAYVDFFTAAMDYVPSHIPHTQGDLWKKSVLHVLQPRVFFPHKPILLSDSELTMRYTGLLLASNKQGTSISLGYMGESYIDFGRYGMFFPIFLVGLSWGLMYSYLISKANIKFIGYGFATALFVFAHQFETASIKLLGGGLMRFIVLALILHFVMPYIADWLQVTSKGVALPAKRVHIDSGVKIS